MAPPKYPIVALPLSYGPRRRYPRIPIVTLGRGFFPLPPVGFGAGAGAGAGVAAGAGVFFGSVGCFVAISISPMFG